MSDNPDTTVRPANPVLNESAPAAADQAPATPAETKAAPDAAGVPSPAGSTTKPFTDGSAVPAYEMPDDTPWKQTWRIFSARMRSLSDQVGRRMMQRTLKIGVSARIFHPETGAKGLRGKTLQYLEESIAQWVMSRDVLVLMIPTVNTNGLLHPSKIRLRDYAKHLDGLVLQGGADVSPQTYSEAATRPEWSGDRARDMYELELLHEFIEAGKPVLGICRGCQLINVAFGGTLYQDIASDVPSAIPHVHDSYDSHRHAIHFPPGSSLAPLFSSQPTPLVNSIHHQAVRNLGRDLTIEAVSGEDNIVEAIRYNKARFVMGLQWHPEFHRAGGAELLDCTPILDNFLRAARETRF
jgi:putative glutamine amidotransferase